MLNNAFPIIQKITISNNNINWHFAIIRLFLKFRLDQIF